MQKLIGIEQHLGTECGLCRLFCLTLEFHGKGACQQRRYKHNGKGYGISLVVCHKGELRHGKEEVEH